MMQFWHALRSASFIEGFKCLLMRLSRQKVECGLRYQSEKLRPLAKCGGGAQPSPECLAKGFYAYENLIVIINIHTLNCTNQVLPRDCHRAVPDVLEAGYWRVTGSRFGLVPPTVMLVLTGLTDLRRYRYPHKMCQNPIRALPIYTHQEIQTLIHENLNN
jgi:hypothetical protein